MSGKLGNEDIEFLSGLVTAEVTRVVNAKIDELKAQVAQTFVDVAINQIRMFGVSVEPQVAESNGQAPHGD